MKNLTFTLLILVWLQLLSFNLSAKNPEGRFNLKEGDWFEIEVNSPLSITTKEDLWAKFFNGISKHELSYQLRYDFQKQLANGNQVFHVSIKRIQSKMYKFYSEVCVGYDSYYPIYKDNIKSATEFIQYTMEVKPDGNIERLDSMVGELPLLAYYQISPRKKTNIGVMMNMLFPQSLIGITSSFLTVKPLKTGAVFCNIQGTENKIKIETKLFTETPDYDLYQCTINDSISTELDFIKNIGVPANNHLLRIVNASFPIPANTVVRGKLPNMEKQDITISLNGDTKENYFPKQNFKTGIDGSFNCHIFLNRPLYLDIRIGDQTISSFIEPNDTLEISNITHKNERISFRGKLYEYESKPGYMVNSDIFSGNAAYNARLSLEMEEWMPYFLLPEDVTGFLDFQKIGNENISKLLGLYNGKATKTCIDYFRSKWKYYLAGDKLYFHEVKQTTIHINQPIGEIFVDESAMDYPSDFFLEVDTLSSVMYPFEWCSQYKRYVGYARDYKKNRLGMSVGGIDDDFYSNYYFDRASLKGWPLYSSLYENIDKELRKGSVAADKIEPFYQDFMNNCSDPSLTEPLRKTRETLDGLAIGTTFPIKSFVQTDSTVFDLAKYKGKPVCLTFIESQARWINGFKREIDNFKSDEVEFIFVCFNNYVDQGRVDSTLLAMPNVHIIEVSDKDLKDKILLSKISKIYMLDKWLRITDDNMLDPNSYAGDNGFKESVEKAIKTKRLSKQERVSIYKTAGWSLGSILFTVLIGLWVYKSRVHRLKKQEAAKRRIKELEIKAVRSQMNPHFIFNALNSIQSLINGNHFKEANIYLSKFAVLLRGVLHNSEKVTVTLSDELQAVELYCQLEQLRFEFKFEMDIDPQVNADIIEIPGMIIQPLVENAIVHGLSPKGSDGRLTIGVERQNGNLCVCVTDNGVGMNPQETDVLSQKGFGLKLVEERINILNLDGKEAKLRVENRNDATGTMATLIIPID